jgi:hypothetical protein
VTSNSGTLRLRHFWVTLQQANWEVLGGQTWTLMTPNRAGTCLRFRADVFVGLGEDSNYLVGLVWGRPGQIRVVYHPDHALVAGGVRWRIPEQFVTTATTVPDVCRYTGG